MDKFLYVLKLVAIFVGVSLFVGCSYYLDHVRFIH